MSKTPILVIFSKKSLKIAKNAKKSSKIAKNAKKIVRNRLFQIAKNAQNMLKIRTGKKVLVLWPALSNKFPTNYIVDVGCFVCLFVCYERLTKMYKMAVFDWLFGFLTTFLNLLGRGKKPHLRIFCSFDWLRQFCRIPTFVADYRSTFSSIITELYLCHFGWLDSVPSGPEYKKCAGS